MVLQHGRASTHDPFQTRWWTRARHFLDCLPLRIPARVPVAPKPVAFSNSATASRTDVYQAAALARLHLMPTRDNVESVLGEYAADHLSITVGDITSPSNYTYYPWTLPPTLVPHNATTAAMKTRPTFDISFPTLPNQSGQPLPPLQRIKEGILVNYVGGLKLSMIQDVPTITDESESDGYRIQAINNLLLGKDERVYLGRDTGYSILDPTDPHFTRIRDAIMLDLIVEVNAAHVPVPTSNTTLSSPNVATLQLPDLDPAADSTVKAAWSMLVSHISSMIKDPNAFAIPNGGNLPGSAFVGAGRMQQPAITSVGKGAAAIPDWTDAQVKPPAANLQQQQNQALQFTTIYATDELCDHKLPASVPRNHQIVLIKRGQCSFSKKLSNIPAYLPTPTALQLVILVSYGNDGDGNLSEDALIRPLLDETQMTSSGLVRHNPIPMIMTSGGEQIYQALKNANGIGIKRRYEIKTHGVPITNLIIV